MKQVIRRVIDRKGRIAVLDLPEAHLGAEQILVQSHYSLISSGTELSTLKKTPIELARQTLSDPWMRHVVKQTILATGLGQTAGRVWQEMIMPREIGYSGAGRVLAVGSAVEGFQVGDKVAYAATGHAELVNPTVNNIVSVPEEVDLRHAAFVTVGGIAMHSLRRAEIQFGETVAVYGLGLVGQLCAMIAKAAGCVVIGIDIAQSRLDAAREAGADKVLDAREKNLDRVVMDATGKQGVDATIICASSSSAEIINSSMEITRRQGRVVVVGYVKLDIHPKNFLYREIDLRYSRAYGPGSYHRAYEQRSLDYPFGYVRWTEGRNLAEVIRLIQIGALDLEALIGSTYPVDKAQGAFDAIRAGTLGGVAALLEYDGSSPADRRRTLPVRPRQGSGDTIAVSIIGCGNQVLGKHLPLLKAMPKVEVRAVASASGKNASMVGKRYGLTESTTDIDNILADSDSHGVLVCSSQPRHFEHLEKLIKAGKSVFVEKPMVTRLEHLAHLMRLMHEKPVLFTLGLNRRYSPILGKLRSLITEQVDAVTYLVAQPFLPPDHWTLDEVDGAGRLITEGEHFIDICNLLIGREPLVVFARALGEPPDDLRTLCNYALTIHYEGAVANVIFDECAAAGFPREQITVAAKGQVAILDDFAHVTCFGDSKKSFGHRLKKEMGHRQALEAFIAALRGEESPMLEWDDAVAATATMFAAQESIRCGQPVDLRSFRSQLLDGEA